MLYFGSDTHDEILGVVKNVRDTKGVRFDYNSMGVENKFIPPKKNNEFLMSNYMSQYPARNLY